MKALHLNYEMVFQDTEMLELSMTDDSYMSMSSVYRANFTESIVREFIFSKNYSE